MVKYNIKLIKDSEKAFSYRAYYFLINNYNNLYTNYVFNIYKIRKKVYAFLFKVLTPTNINKDKNDKDYNKTKEKNNDNITNKKNNFAIN